MPYRKERLKEIEPNEQGIYEYTGKHCKMSRRSGAFDPWYVLVFSLVLSIVFFFASDISADGLNAEAIYMTLPFAGEAISIFILAWNLVRLLAGRDRIRETVIGQTEGRILGASFMLMLFAVISIVNSVAYIAIYNLPNKSLIYPLLQLAEMVTAYYLRRTYKQIEWRLVE